MPTVTTGRTIRTNHDKENPYFMLARATAQDKGISYEALGILTYLLSQSDRWEINVSELAKRGSGEKKRGMTRIYRILKELREHGYITLEREYVKGKISRWIYQVFERPIELDNQNLFNQNLDVENDDSNKEKEIPESTKKNIAAKDAAQKPDEPKPSVQTEKVKAVRPPNPWYDNIKTVWGCQAGENTDLEKLLRGVATKKGHKEYNVPDGYTLNSPEEVCHFARWYRDSELKGDETLTMVRNPGKLQSAVMKWVDNGRPSGNTAAYQFDTYELIGG
jgi:DNA-binding PadR family transcriptional regulator